MEQTKLLFDDSSFPLGGTYPPPYAAQQPVVMQPAAPQVSAKCQ